MMLVDGIARSVRRMKRGGCASKGNIGWDRLARVRSELVAIHTIHTTVLPSTFLYIILKHASSFQPHLLCHTVRGTDKESKIRRVKDYVRGKV
jgi:hypothetical protein